MALGAINDQQGEGEKAEAYYRKALEIKSDFVPAANNLAWNLAERGRNIDEALGFAQIAKEQMPKNAAVMDTLGWIYYLKGTYVNAISELQDSVALDPHNPVINYHLGMAYFKNNQPDEAREFLKKALAIDPNFKGAGEASSILKRVQM
jgi:tetratricopeptide (TPR) repeat protein